MYVSVKFYLYEILIHSVIHLLINIFLYQITISYPSGKRTQLVRNKLHQALCKAICKSENVEQTVISLLVKEKPREVVDAAAKVVSEEARELCQRNSNSILMKKDQESLMSFTWDKFNKELEIRAPNVLRIVSSIVSDIPPMIGEKKYMNILHTVASGLHGRSTEMSGLHYTIAFVLVHGGCTLRVFMSYALTIY